MIGYFVANFPSKCLTCAGTYPFSSANPLGEGFYPVATISWPRHTLPRIVRPRTSNEAREEVGEEATETGAANFQVRSSVASTSYAEVSRALKILARDEIKLS